MRERGRKRGRRSGKKRKGRITQMKERTSIRILERNVIIKVYHEQLLANKSENSDEKDKFPERQKLPKMTAV